MSILLLIIGAMALFMLAGGLSLNSGYVPTPQDEQLRMEVSATITATAAGTTKDMRQGFAPGGIGLPVAAVVSASAVDRTTGDETYTWKLQESVDGATWTDCGPPISITAASTFSVPGFLSQRYVRLSATLAGTTPIVTYEAWLNTNLGL